MRLLRFSWVPAALLLAACGGNSAEAVIASDYQDLPADRVLFDATYITTVDGIRRAVQRSDTMYIDEDSTQASLFGVKLLMYDTLGRQQADLTSVRGLLNQRTQEMVAQGNVVLLLADGRRVETEELHYDPEGHRIWSDVTTRMESTPGCVATFETFTVDDKFNNPTGTNARGCVPGLRL